MTQQRGKCYYCGCKLVLGYDGNVNIDHVKPFSKYRDGTRGNLCLSCSNCNSFKSDLDMEDFRIKCRNRNIILKRNKFFFERRNIKLCQ